MTPCGSFAIVERVLKRENQEIMKTKGWIIFAVIAIGLLGALIYFSKTDKISVDEFDKNAIITANEKNGNIGDNFSGPKDGKVVLIEYGDFQCPGCGSIHPQIKEMTSRYDDNLVFIFRNLPLSSMHPNARIAAAAAEAAGLQGKYWEMHHKIYDNQKEWESASTSDRGEIFRSYAKSLNLDLAKFDTDIASKAVTQKIAFDQEIFKLTGLRQSSPTFILNGEPVESEVWGDKEAFDTLIRKKLTAAGVTLPEKVTSTEE